MGARTCAPDAVPARGAGREQGRRHLPGKLRTEPSPRAPPSGFAPGRFQGGFLARRRPRPPTAENLRVGTTRSRDTTELTLLCRLTDTRTDVSVGSTRNASHAHPAVRPSPNPNVKTRLLQTRRKETRRASTDTKDRRTSEQDVEGGLSDAAFARCPRPPCFAPAEGAVPSLRDIGPEVKRRERDVGPVPASRRCASHRRLEMSAPLHCHSRRSFMRCF